MGKKAESSCDRENWQSMSTPLDPITGEERRRQFWEKFNAAYTALREDPEAWKEELEERALWEATLADGLDEE